MGLKCYDNDEHLESRAESIISMWEERLSDLAQALMPITMVMYCAALLPTGKLLTETCFGVTVPNLWSVAFKKDSPSQDPENKNE
jgi:hypothetical protein